MNRDKSYLFAFLDEDGEFYDYYISDGLQELETWEAIDFKFSLPHSKFILIWRRDGKKFTKKESEYLTKYVRDDMKEYMNEGVMADENGKVGDEGSQTKIRKKLLPLKDCLILAYDTLELPVWFTNWDDLVDEIKPLVLEKLNEPKFKNLQDEAVLDILTGKIPTNPYLENYKFRSKIYNGFELPSDHALKEVYHQIQRKNFVAAANYLSGTYQISPPNIDTITELPGQTFVFYDNLDSKIMLSVKRIPEFWQQLPALFLGFFKHLSQSKNWKFSDQTEQNPIIEKSEAEKFSQMMISRLLELGLDPRKM